MPFDLLITQGTAVTTDAVFRANVAVNGGKIAALLSPQDMPAAGQVIDAAGCYVLPGAVDAHVHLHMLTAAGIYSADDWCTGTRAAALGGVTSVVDFIQALPGQTLMEALHERVDDARDAVIDYGFHTTIHPDEAPIGGVNKRVSDYRIGEIRQAADAGCPTFKMYQAYSGLQVQDADLFRALRAIAEVNGLACVHAENGDVLQALRDAVTSPAELVNGLNHARTRPAIQEAEAVNRTIMCAELSGARVLIFHISCDLAGSVVAGAKGRGLTNVFGETCPQYLVFTDDKLARPDARLWMCAPPLRPQADQDALWRKLKTGVLDVVSSDHCPFTRAQKDLGVNDFRRVPNGMPGIETRLGLLYEYGVRAGKISLNDWVRVCSTRPAELHGLRSKGRLAPGYDADIVIFDPDSPRELSAAQLHSALDYSVCDGMTCAGWARDVLLRGRAIVQNGRHTGRAGDGQFLKRSF